MYHCAISVILRIFQIVDASIYASMLSFKSSKGEVSVFSLVEKFLSHRES